MSQNNQNSLNMSSYEEPNYHSMKKRIQQQNIKLQQNEQRLKQLKKKIQQKKKSIQKKKLRIEQLQQNIQSLQSKQSQILIKNNIRKQNQQQQQSVQSIFSNPLYSSNDPASLALLQHLRQHYKALKFGLFRHQDDNQDDDDQYYDQVDVDNMTYQELLQLGEKIGKVSKGLDKKKIQLLQVKKWNQSQSQSNEQKHSSECCICRDQFQNGIQFIQLNCTHVFHNECIKQWLKMEKHCPYCKTQIFNKQETIVLNNKN